MSREVWATYSVKDHLNPRALAADIMLFDRLVFPVPQVADLQFEKADPTQHWPVVWSKNSGEWAHWKSKQWDPEAQESLLKILEKVVRKVAWDVPHREAWRKEYAAHAESQLPGYAFEATKTVLTRDLPAYVTGVEAMGPAYRSIEQLEQELGMQKNGSAKTLPGSALSAVLGWEFLVPDDNQLSDQQLLERTVAFVTQDDKFRSHRTNFWNWQQQYLRNGKTDAESIKVAVSDMSKLLKEQKAAASKLPVKTTVRYAFRIAPATLAFAGSFMGPVGAAIGAGAGVFLAGAEIAAEKWFFKTPGQNEASPAAFVHDVHRHFGWK
jgi:hypothetical protein